jgi:magnesium transporter
MVIKKGKINWIHLVRPTQKEVHALQEEFGIHPLIANELLEASARSKVEVYDSYMFLVLHLPIFDMEEKVSRKGEMDFIITDEAVISVQYEDLEPTRLMQEKLEDDHAYKDRLLGGDTARLLYYIIEAGIVFALRQLRHIDAKIEDIRNNMFKDEEKKLLEKISYLKRDLLSYFLITKSQIGIFSSLSRTGPDFFGDKSRVYFADLEGDFQKVIQLCENFKETIEAFENTNTQLLTIRMTKVMQRFSVLAFLTFPIMVFLALFTIDSSSRPIINKTPHDFAIMAAIVVVSLVGMSLIFRKKGWL